MRLLEKTSQDLRLLPESRHGVCDRCTGREFSFRLLSEPKPFARSGLVLLIPTSLDQPMGLSRAHALECDFTAGLEVDLWLQTVSKSIGDMDSPGCAA